MKNEKFTSECINCLEPAKIYAGHLKNELGYVIAGFCSKECHSLLKSNEDGCFGYWEPKYGVENRDFLNKQPIN